MNPNYLTREELEYEAKIRGIYQHRNNLRSLKADIVHRIQYEINHNLPLEYINTEDINIHDELPKCNDKIKELLSYSTNPKKHNEIFHRGSHLILRFSRIDMSKVNDIELYQKVQKKIAQLKDIMENITVVEDNINPINSQSSQSQDDLNNLASGYQNPTNSQMTNISSTPNNDNLLNIDQDLDDENSVQTIIRNTNIQSNSNLNKSRDLLLNSIQRTSGINGALPKNSQNNSQNIHVSENLQNNPQNSQNNDQVENMRLQILAMQQHFEKQMRQMENLVTDISISNANASRTSQPRPNNVQSQPNSSQNRPIVSRNENPYRTQPSRNRLQNDDEVDSDESNTPDNRNYYNNRRNNSIKFWKIQYSGGNTSPSLDQFLILVEAHRKADGLTKDQVFKSAIHLLKDAALDIYLSKMDRIQNWTSLVKVLKQAFDGGNSQHNLRLRIEQTIQGQKESFSSFLARIMNLIKCTEPLMPEYQQVYLIKRNMIEEISSKLALYDIDNVDMLEVLAMRIERNLSEIKNRINPRQSNYSDNNFKSNQIHQTNFDENFIQDSSETNPDTLDVEYINNDSSNQNKFQNNNFNRNNDSKLNQNRTFQNNPNFNRSQTYQNSNQNSNHNSNNRPNYNNNSSNFNQNKNNNPNNSQNRTNIPVSSNTSDLRNQNNGNQNKEGQTQYQNKYDPKKPYCYICRNNDHHMMQCKFNLLAMMKNLNSQNGNNKPQNSSSNSIPNVNQTQNRGTNVNSVENTVEETQPIFPADENDDMVC